MRWEFLAGPLMFIVVVGCCKLNTETAGIMTGIIAGSIIGVSGMIFFFIPLSFFTGHVRFIAFALLPIGLLAVIYKLNYGEFKHILAAVLVPLSIPFGIFGAAFPPSIGKFLYYTIISVIIVFSTIITISVIKNQIGTQHLRTQDKKAGEIVLFTLVLLIFGRNFLYLIFGTVAGVMSATVIVADGRFVKHIKKLYSELLSLYISLSAFLLFPPFIAFSSFYALRKIKHMNLLPGWFLYASTVVVTIVLSVLCVRFYDRLFLKFFNASVNEKQRWTYISDYPCLFCERHLLKPVKIKKALFYSDVRCRAKGCSHEFATGVKQVTGLIGADTDYSRKQDRVYINLWSEEQKTARNADIDILEIRDARGISYDYALNATLVTLKNDASRPKRYVKKIPVVIHGNPCISEGTKVMLEHEFKEMKSKCDFQ
ncbi:MAG: hypothetical protein GY795_45500 [Desulfobacterales bacterium]|nr:hypothetical protein [Desulfobacterales bacterium]